MFIRLNRSNYWYKMVIWNNLLAYLFSKWLLNVVLKFKHKHDVLVRYLCAYLADP